MPEPSQTDCTAAIVVPCKGRLESLKQSLPNMVGQPDCSVVVVDYDCPDHCGDWVEAAHPGVKVVRVTGQAMYNHNDARLRGVEQTSAPWLCFVDADIVLASEFAGSVLPLLQRGLYFRAEPWDDHTFGTYICHRDDYGAAGGHDPVMQGYGSKESDLFWRLEHIGVRSSHFPGVLIRHLPHDDAERTRHYEVKDRWASHTVNRIYSVAKLDLWKLGGRYPSVQVRQKLYKIVRRDVSAAVEANEPRFIRVPISRAKLLAEHQLMRMLAYRVTPKPQAAGDATP